MNSNDFEYLHNLYSDEFDLISSHANAQLRIESAFS